MIKEDELLAKALQQQEHDQHKPDLREIMDMELAMALYKQDEVSVVIRKESYIICISAFMLLMSHEERFQDQLNPIICPFLRRLTVEEIL